MCVCVCVTHESVTTRKGTEATIYDLRVGINRTCNNNYSTRRAIEMQVSLQNYNPYSTVFNLSYLS